MQQKYKYYIVARPRRDYEIFLERVFFTSPDDALAFVIDSADIDSTSPLIYYLCEINRNGHGEEIASLYYQDGVIPVWVSRYDEAG